MTTKGLTALSALFFALSVFGQSPEWKTVQEPIRENRQIIPSSYELLGVDLDELKTYLLQAPSGTGILPKYSDFILSIPTPDGEMADFRITQTPVMAPELQERYPQIRTFTGQGTGAYAGALAKFDFTTKGFHAQILLSGKSYYIDPYSPEDLEIYLVYSREAFYASTDKSMPQCTVEDGHVSAPPAPEDWFDGTDPQGRPIPVLSQPQGIDRTVNGSQLRTYALALACTGEYASFHGGTTTAVMSAFTTTMNRVNGLFERDLSLTMVMVADNDELINLNAATDPYTNSDVFALLEENQTVCDAEIGSANYDIGHVFGTSGGGVAYIQAVCDNSIKAGGVSSLPNPVGDPFDVDYVCHELGHQWGANHTQNNACNRSSGAAYEPGSASTIMGYAGICPPNLQFNSDDHFHNHSFNEMYSFSVLGSGNTCATTSSTGNIPPSLSVPTGGFFIPISTPFELTATATDPDDDELSYCWEQYDLGPATASGDANLTNPSGNAPIFRSWSPTSNPTRVFPRLSDLVNNTTVIGELLPTYSRDLTFRCNS
jgi:hypothetical protein